VANIARFVPQLRALPGYVTAAERGRGFAEVARAVLEAKPDEVAKAAGDIPFEIIDARDADEGLNEQEESKSKKKPKGKGDDQMSLF